MTTKAVFVLGPESSGTRLMTRLLIRAGCVGNASHEQGFDAAGLPAPDGRDVVWRRSLPHGGAWPDVREMIDAAAALGYEPRVVFMHRDVSALIASQLAAPHVKTEAEAVEHIDRVYRDYHDRLSEWGVSHANVNYETLFSDGWGVMLDLLRWLDLSTVLGERLYDGNAKYAEDAPA